MEKIKLLLNEIKIIIQLDKNKKTKDDKFNIYSIARIERDEVGTHSRMIAELLNPKGKHGQCAKFLNSFIKIVVGLEDLRYLNNCNSTVIIEKAIKQTDELYGRIDVFIELENLIIIIENKIDAGDQDKQLDRYYQSAKNINKELIILYLTINGNEPSLKSLGKIKKNINGNYIYNDDENKIIDLKLISYKNEILSWLKKCLLCCDENLVKAKSGIGQYLSLVEKITGNTMSNETEKEMRDILSGYENILAAKKISDTLQSSKFRGQLIFKFLDKLKSKILSHNEDNIFIDTTEPALDDSLKAFSSSQNDFIKWCERGKKNKGWECKGIFIGIKGTCSLLHMQFATDFFYYGVVPRTDKFCNILSNSNLTLRDWPALKWYAHQEFNAKEFDNNSLLLLTNPDSINSLANKIHEDVSIFLYSKQS